MHACFRFFTYVYIHVYMYDILYIINIFHIGSWFSAVLAGLFQLRVHEPHTFFWSKLLRTVLAAKWHLQPAAHALGWWWYMKHGIYIYICSAIIIKCNETAAIRFQRCMLLASFLECHPRQPTAAHWLPNQKLVPYDSHQAKPKNCHVAIGSGTIANHFTMLRPQQTWCTATRLHSALRLSSGEIQWEQGAMDVIFSGHT